MKQIKNGFCDYYYLTNDGKVYNNITKKYLKLDKYNYRLMTKQGIAKKIALKELYKIVYNKVYCVDTIENLENEIWEEIPNTQGNYYISNCGRLKSYCKYNAFIMKLTVTPKNYKRVQIVINGIAKNEYVHRLVASCFLEPPKSIDYQLHHIDGNGLNNKASNLIWLSVEEHYKIHNKKENKDNEK